MVGIDAGVHGGLWRRVASHCFVLLAVRDVDEDLRELLSRCEGVVLGGSSLDLDPKRLGLDKHPATKPMATRREDFDRRLAKMAVEMRLPILAIGSGMQTVNVICGGTLFQHIPEDVARPIQHRDHVERTLRHIINIVPGTRMDAMYGPGEIRVNSDHHMCVDQLAPVFKASATAPDGVIEAFESVDDDWFCVGVQWHPESDTAAALDMQAFEIFMGYRRKQNDLWCASSIIFLIF